MEEPISTIYEKFDEASDKPNIDRYPTIETVLEARRRLNPEAGEVNSKGISNEANEMAKAKLGNYKYKLVEKKTIQTDIQNVMSVDWSESGDLLGVCGDEGTVFVYSRQGQEQYSFKPNSSGLPTTCIKWRPRSESLGSLQVLVSVDCTGQIVHWHVPSEKEIYRLQEDENQIYSVQYRSDGEMFATSGKDCKVRLYDENTKTLLSSFEKGESMYIGHSNRVFATCFQPDNKNILVSGGWENTLILWDIREGKPTKTIYGPFLAGQSLDIQNETILTGSWRAKDTLETWDIGTGKKLRDVGHQVTAKVYTAQFHNSIAGLFMAGGANEATTGNSLRLYDLNDDEVSNAVYLNNNRGIYTSSINRHSEIAIAGNSPGVGIYKMQ